MVLETRNLSLKIKKEDKSCSFLTDINISIKKGEGVALVGESGSGKSLLCLSILKLNPINSIISGEIIYKEKNITNLELNKIREIRGKEIGIIFQEPIHSFNPIYTIGNHMDETLNYGTTLSKKERIKKTKNILSSVGFWDSEIIMKLYPYQLSGGMIQRVLMAQTLSLNPQLLIADEPATSLDLTSKKYILELLYEKVRLNNMSLLLVTHNFSIIPKLTEFVYVMYGGMIVESGKTIEVIKNPHHPYTKNLLKAIPSLLSDNEELISNNYTKPPICETITTCPFLKNCSKVKKICLSVMPQLKKINSSQKVRCFLYE